VPTISEAGVRGYEVAVWQGMVAPAGTPQIVIAQLNRQISGVLRLPDVRGRLAVQGLEAVTSLPGDFQNYIAAEFRKWAAVIRQAGVVAD
jgi:tripartite-type tricarboxylate transporter receptor subunit TctC